MPHVVADRRAGNLHLCTLQVVFWFEPCRKIITTIRNPTYTHHQFVVGLVYINNAWMGLGLRLAGSSFRQGNRRRRLLGAKQITYSPNLRTSPLSSKLTSSSIVDGEHSPWSPTNDKRPRMKHRRGDFVRSITTQLQTIPSDLILVTRGSRSFVHDVST
jgi:hypothetical protein